MKARLALISEHASPLTPPGSVDSGGQNVYVAQVARHLAQLGFEVDIFTRRDCPDQLLVQPWLPGVRVIHVPAGPARFVPKEQMLTYMDQFADFMCDFIQGNKRCPRSPLNEPTPYDCIHANFFMSAYAGCQLREQLNIPLVITFHALGKVRRLHQAAADGFPPEREAIEQDAMSIADVVIAECPADRRDLIELYGAEPDKIRTVACGFDEEEVSPMPKEEACRQLGIRGDMFTVLQLGRMVPRKGVDDTIRGFAIACRRGLNGRLIVVGCDVPGCVTKSQELNRLRGIAESEGVSERVLFAGQCSRSEIRKYYAACDVFVTVPWYEPFGITPLEAMACGRPVIGSKVGGIQSTVRDGITGFHVPPKNPVAIAGRLLELYEQPELVSQLGLNALQWVRSKYTWRSITEQLAEVYMDLIADGVQVPMSSLDAAGLDAAGLDASNSEADSLETSSLQATGFTRQAQFWERASS